jgi:prepilin-type N-terminal cleavage/methylation domain-containing protein
MADERGMTIIEVTVALALMAVGVLALMTTFNGSRDLVSSGERSGIAAHQGELEIEKALSLDYAKIALPTIPSHSASSTSPDFYVNGGGTYQWDQSASPQPADPLVADAANGSLVHVSAWSDGQSRLNGSVYRYVTWIDDPQIAGTHDAKRITIAVTVNTGGANGLKNPVLVSTIAIDPTAG